MKTNNFIISCADTDSITFSNGDGSPFSDEEILKLLNEANSLFPQNVKLEFEEMFQKIIVLKAKNYVLWDGTKVKYKGSALKSPTLESAYREFLREVVNSILEEKFNYIEIYNKYVLEILNIKDINRYSKRMTISEKTLESERTNESKVRDALEGSDYVEGDRIWVYFTPERELKLVEHYDGKYDLDTYLEKLHKTAMRFEPIIKDIKTIFPNYKLKKNKKLLDERQIHSGFFNQTLNNVTSEQAS